MRIWRYLLLASMLWIVGLENLYSQSCGSVNVALGKTVTTSSNGAGTNGGGITDGLLTNPYTIWQPVYTTTELGGNWATIDLGSSKTICRVLMKWGRYNSPASFKIRMSATSSTGPWVDIMDVPSHIPLVGNNSGDYYTQFVYDDLNITQAGNTGRYIQVWVGTISSPNWFVSEMEVFEVSGQNSLPGVTLINPSSDTTFAANTAVALKVNAVDLDGTISQVSYYEGNNLLGTSQQTSNPFSFTWIPTESRTYSIKAVATDNNGATGNSLTRTVMVTPENPGWGLFGTAASSASSTSPVPAFIGTTDTTPFIVKTNSLERFRVTPEGKMLMGSTLSSASLPSNTLLTVNGYIVSKGLKVTQLASNWPDYVFDKDYSLMPLPELADFIRKNKHLPGIPTAFEVQKEGVSVAENQALLLKKIEELTLYILELNKKLEAQNQKIEAMQAKPGLTKKN